MIDNIEAFLQSMEAKGIVCMDDIIADGQIHRFSPDGCTEKPCWYVFHETHGYFGDWHDPDNWKSWNVDLNALTLEERQHLKAESEKARNQWQAEQTAKHNEAAHNAKDIWEQSFILEEHPYLKKKQVNAYAIKAHKSDLIIPLYDVEGKLWSLQRIFPDGRKRFLTGGKKKGCFHLIGTLENDKLFYVVEGYATGASIHMATGLPVVIAFDAGNIEPVISELRAKYPDSLIIIAADNDQWKEANTGKTKAEEAAIKHKCKVALPEFSQEILRLAEARGLPKPTDWNDKHVLERIEEVKRQLQVSPMSSMSVDDIWPEPKKIETSLLPVEPLPLGILPEAYQPWIGDISHRMQCPPDIAAATAVVMTGAVIGAGCGIRPKRHDNWMVIPNLYGGCIGRPSVIMKSPTMQETMKPLKRLQQESREKFEKAQREHEVDMEICKGKKEFLKTGMKKGKGNDAQLQSFKADYLNLIEPDQPVWQRFITNDATIEKIGELCNESPRGILVFRDELVGLFTSWEKQGHENDRAFYLEGWNGSGEFTTDRVGRGTVYTKSLCISVFGGIQPDKLNKYMNRFRQDNDGIIQRFQLLVYPDLPKDWKLIDEKPNKEAGENVYQILKMLSTMDFIKYGAIAEEGEIPYFRFSDDAQALFFDWLIELETVKLRGGDDPLIVEHLGKFRKLMPALALQFHLVDIASGKASGNVSLAAAERAAAWCDYLESHARRVYGVIASLPAQAATSLSKHIEKGDLTDNFTLRDIYRHQWSLLQDKEIVQSACDILVQHDWLQELETPASYGQRSKIEYLINPKIKRSK